MRYDRLFLSGLTLTIAALFLSSCASLQFAGTAQYSIEPVLIDGKTVCCRVSVKNGKEIAMVKVHAEKTGDDYTFDLQELGVAAFPGQQIAADAAPAAGTVLAPLLPLMLP